MGVFNAASKMRAAVRTRGKMLVGQARYPWIARVGSTPRRGLGSEERLIIDASETEIGTYRLTLGLSHTVDAASIAAEVVRRTARYRLASEADLTIDERADLERLRDALPIEPIPSRGKNHIYFHEMPTCWYISEQSARFAPK
jgi:hypothetical protein